MTLNVKDRHPAVQAYANYFDGGHLSHPDLRFIVDEFENLAQNMLNRLGDAPEVSHMLRRLVEAKDCAVRAKVDELRAAGTPAPANVRDLPDEDFDGAAKDVL